MRRIVIVIMVLLVVLTLPAFGMGLEELARQRIAQETGLDQELIATMFVTEEDAEFILTFIYIDDRIFNSRLKPELLEAISPYRNREAMLVLVTPTRESYFNPLWISFTQDRVTYRVRWDAIHRISEGFTAGALPAGEVSAGVVLLDRLEPEFELLPGGGLQVNKPFKINYLGRYSANFALNSGEPLDIDIGLDTGLIQSFFLYLLNIFLILLFAFLI